MSKKTDEFVQFETDVDTVLKRHKPYFESDHVLNFVYNFLTGGEVINDIERLQEAEGILRILGTERIVGSDDCR